jgi:hypothetical protein
MDEYFVNERSNKTIGQTLVKTWSRIGQVYNSTRERKISHNQAKKSITFSITFFFAIGDGSLKIKFYKGMD